MITEVIVKSPGQDKLLCNSFTDDPLITDRVLLDCTPTEESKKWATAYKTSTVVGFGQNPMSSLNQVLHQIKTPTFVIRTANTTFYKDKLNASFNALKLMNKISIVYTDYELFSYEVSKTSRVFEYPYDSRICLQGYWPNINNMYATVHIKNAGGFTKDMNLKLMQNTILLHIPEALFCEKQ